MNSPASSSDPYASSKAINTLRVRFNLPLRPAQIPAFRGAVAASMNSEEPLFHNHQGSESANGQSSGLHQRYPLIQYRSRKGRAEIWAMNQGTLALHDWLAAFDLRTFKMNGQPTPLKIQNLRQERNPIRLSAQYHTYRLLDWAALNQENYERWRRMLSLRERVALLDQILCGQILGFAKACDFHFPGRLEAHLLHLRSSKNAKLHGVDRLVFNVLFRANVKLPAGLALGRGVAFGFGGISPVRARLD